MTPPSTTELVLDIKDALPELAERLERGESARLLHHGKQVGRATPTEEPPLNEAQAAFRELMDIGKRIRARGGGITLEEFQSWKNERGP